MASIFDLVTAEAVTSYWEQLSQNLAPYLGDELFPASKKLGLDLKWIKGSRGLPVVLAPSAYDVKARKRNRIGFDKLSAQMPYFKEGYSIDEELRQQLNMVLETGNSAYIDAVMNQVFDDETNLLQGAAAQRERMRMQALTTGAISISANGQDYDYDYQLPAAHKSEVATSWSTPTVDIFADIENACDKIENDTGVRPSRAVVSQKTWGYIRANTNLRNAILGNDSAAPVSDDSLRTFILDNLGVDVQKYTKKFKTEAGVETAYIPDDVFTLFPSGTLGTGWFGTTPEESDLLTGSAANVSITDTGVAITTTKETDPVQVTTKASMIYLPSFEAADQVYILDVIKNG